MRRLRDKSYTPHAQSFIYKTNERLSCESRPCLDGELPPEPELPAHRLADRALVAGALQAGRLLLARRQSRTRRLRRFAFLGDHLQCPADDDLGRRCCLEGKRRTRTRLSIFAVRHRYLP